MMMTDGSAIYIRYYTVIRWQVGVLLFTIEAKIKWVLKRDIEDVGSILKTTLAQNKKIF